MKKDNCALIVFIKNPVSGKVKTRLAKDIGDKKALEVYQSLLNITRIVCQKVDATRYLYYSDSVEDDDWSPTQFQKRVQSRGDLGQRMSSAFAEVLNIHDKVVIIGSDCPDINEEIIAQSFSILDHSDIVIGPSVDGGYYLLGMKQLHNFLFTDMPWSQPNLLEETTNKIEASSYNYSTMGTLSDLDYLDDLNEYKDKISKY